MRAPVYFPFFFLLLLLLAPADALFSQPMSRSVIGSAGDYFQHPTAGDLHWTVGEVAVATLRNEIELSEGFHQGYYELIVSTNAVAVEWAVRVFPNPVMERLRIQAPDAFTGRAVLFDQVGRRVGQVELVEGRAELAVTNLPAGVYWLTVRSGLGRQRTFQVQVIRS